jgi:hypothetical protein
LNELGKVANLIQEYRSSMGDFEQTLLVGHRSLNLCILLSKL